MKIFAYTAVLLSLGSLTACSHTWPLHGDLSNGKEPFIGTTTNNPDGSGTMAFTTQNGVPCDGTFRSGGNSVTSIGNFQCQDSRKGTFSFTSNGIRGEGLGKTSSGEGFKFVFGHKTEL